MGDVSITVLVITWMARHLGRWEYEACLPKTQSDGGGTKQIEAMVLMLKR